MAWQAGLAWLGLGALVVIGIGVVVYVVKKRKENPHSYAEVEPSNSEEQVGTLLTYGDINPASTQSVINPTSTQTGLRKRQTAQKSEEEKQNQLNKEISKVNGPNLTTHEKSAYEKRIANLEKIIAEKDPKIAELQSLISDLQREKEKEAAERGKQATTLSPSTKVQEWLNNEIPASQNVHTEDYVESVVDSVSVDSVESVRSFDSTNSRIQEKPVMLVQKILTWDEMSANDKHNAVCLGCEGAVETVTSCNHPYMCLECVSDLFLNYKYCTWCDKKLTGYKKLVTV